MHAARPARQHARTSAGSDPAPPRQHFRERRTLREGPGEKEASVNANEVAAERRTPVRVGLLLLAVGQGITGAWALFAPRSWYDHFPGGGAKWLPGFGPYNEHFSADIGATFLGLVAGLVFAAVVLDRRAIQTALVAYLVFAVPHTIYHLTQLDALSTKDNVLNMATLGATVVLPVALLALVRRPSSLGARPPDPG
jgi:hypothetical protein